MIKRILQVAAISLFAAALAFIASTFTIRVKAQLFPLKAFQVWSTTEWSNNTSADTYFGRRSNGDTITMGLTDGIKEYNLASSGTLVVASNKTSNVSTLGSGKPYLPQDNDGTCSQFGSDVVQGESKQMLGFNVLHVFYSRRITSASGSVGENTVSQWVAPALDCYPLEDERRWYADGKATAFEIKKATAASVGEPLPGLFAVPTNVVEVSPSVFWPSVGRSAFPQQDKAYNKDKAKRSSLW